MISDFIPFLMFRISDFIPFSAFSISDFIPFCRKKAINTIQFFQEEKYVKKKAIFRPYKLEEQS